MKRTRLDPIYELTNAIADRNAQDSLLSAGFFPLQILAAIVNQIRRLLLVKGFVESPLGKKVWKTGMAYNPFVEKVMPAIQEYDKALTDYSESGGNGDKKKKKTGTDLVIAKNPKSPYPVYQVLLKSEKFTRNDLVNALESLSKADTKFKTSGGSPKLIPEELILRICQKNF